MGHIHAARLSLKSPVPHELQSRVPYALRDVPAVGAAQPTAFQFMGMDTVFNCVRQAPLFRGLSVEDCAYIACRSKERHLPRREMLFRQGELQRQIFVLASGRLKITQVGTDGDEVIVRLKNPGDVVGALGVAPGTPISCGAQALEPCHLIFWDLKAMESFSDRWPIIHRNTASILIDTLRDMQDRYRELATEKVAMRLARTLLRLLGNAERRAGSFGSTFLARRLLR